MPLSAISRGLVGLVCLCLCLRQNNNKGAFVPWLIANFLLLTFTAEVRVAKADDGEDEHQDGPAGKYSLLVKIFESYYDIDGRLKSRQNITKMRATGLSSFFPPLYQSDHDYIIACLPLDLKRRVLYMCITSKQENNEWSATKNVREWTEFFLVYILPSGCVVGGQKRFLLPQKAVFST